MAVIYEEELTFAPGESRTVTFTVAVMEAGVYRVIVDGLSGELTVTPLSTISPPWPPELPGLPVRDADGRWLFVRLREPDGNIWAVTAASMIEYPIGVTRPLWQYLIKVEGNTFLGYQYAFSASFLHW